MGFSRNPDASLRVNAHIHEKTTAYTALSHGLQRLF